MNDETKSVDLLGVKPIGESLKIATQGTIDGVSAVLSRICLPAAEEFGLLFRDHIRNWRLQNLMETLKKTEEKLRDSSENLHAHPRIVWDIVDKCSYADDALVQELWSGLLVSSCTTDGDDDSNLIFTRLLESLTKVQARILKFICESSKKYTFGKGLIATTPMYFTLDQLFEISDCRDIQRLDYELDNLRDLGLIDITSGLSQEPEIDITPISLALHLYVRCQGSRMSPLEFFGVKSGE